MALETVAENKRRISDESLEEIFRHLCSIASLAQVLQLAASEIEPKQNGVYGTASVIEEMADRAAKLTGV